MNDPGNAKSGKPAISGCKPEIGGSARRQEDLERSRVPYRTIVDSLREGIWVLDADLRTEFVNKRLCAILGYEEREMLGRRSTDFTYDEDVSDVQEKLRKAKSGVGSRYERRFHHRDGSLVWTEVSVNPRFDDDGLYIGSVAVVIDISERKRAEIQQALQRDVLEKVAASRPLPEILQVIADGLTSMMPGSACSVYTLGKGEWVCRAARGHPPELAPDDRLPAARTDTGDAAELLGDAAWTAVREAARRAGFEDVRLTPIRQFSGGCLGLILGHFQHRDQRAASRLEPEALDNAARYARAAIQDARAEQQLRDKEERFRILVEYAPDAIVVFDGMDGRFIDVNANAAALFNCPREKLLGMTPGELSPERQPDGALSTEAGMEKIEAAVNGEAPVFEWTHLRLDGTPFPAEVRLVRLPDSEGRVLIRGSIMDISERRAHERDLRFLASRDPLTGLLNRTVFVERLEHAVKLATRRGSTLTVVFMDLDRFKDVNDRLGHAHGDTLLRHVADSLVATLRESDTIARLGGDEFTMVLEDTDDPVNIEKIIDKLRKNVSRPVILDGEEYGSTASLGVAFYPRDGHDAESLLKAADAAMYEAKQAGGDCYRLVDV